MKLFNENVAALVLSTCDGWKTCCVTEYGEDGTWYCGMNMITSVEDALETAEKNDLNIIFESMLNDPKKVKHGKR